MFFSEKNNGKKDKNGELLLFDCLYSISPEDAIIRRAVMFRAEKHFCFVFIFFFFCEWTRDKSWRVTHELHYYTSGL